MVVVELPVFFIEFVVLVLVLQCSVFMAVLEDCYFGVLLLEDLDAVF